MNYSDNPSPDSKAEQVWWLVSATPIPGGGWMLAILDFHSQTPLAMEVFASAPDADTAWGILSDMLQVAETRGQKPTRISLEPGWLLQALHARLKTAGVAAGAKPVQPGGIVGLLGEGRDGSKLPGLLATGEIPAQAGLAFFRAARRFYRAATWEMLGEDEAIAVQLLPTGRLGFVVLLGQAGPDTGLLTYADWEQTYLHTAGGAALEDLPESGALALIFATAEDLPPADRAVIRRRRWPVAGAHAYPLAMRMVSGDIQRPDAEDLFFLEAVLNALPDFVHSQLAAVLEGEEAEAVAEYEVETWRGNVSIMLSYPAGPDDQTAWQTDAASSEAEKLALALAHAAWQTEDGAERMRLANEALALSPDAIEAYLALAEEADYPQEALALLEKAVQAGERAAASGPNESGGAGEAGLWARRAARPYLRALQAKAETLEQLGRGAQALEVYHDLLRLNPPDHSGARYPALALLLRLKRDDEAAALLERYSADDSPDWAFGCALSAYRAQGDSQTARRFLAEAIQQHPLVGAFLTGSSALLADPNEAESQAEADAAAYALRAYPIWWSTPGAIEWLRAGGN